MAKIKSINTDEPEIKFKKAVAMLNFADVRLESKLRCKTISKRKYNKLHSILNDYWIHVFDFLHSEEENTFFHENFQ